MMERRLFKVMDAWVGLITWGFRGHPEYSSVQMLCTRREALEEVCKG
jgi:hypothetical protein